MISLSTLFSPPIAYVHGRSQLHRFLLVHGRESIVDPKCIIAYARFQQLKPRPSCRTKKNRKISIGTLSHIDDVLPSHALFRHTITKTYLYNFEPFKPHFYIVKLGSSGVDIIFFYFCIKKNRLWVLVRTASPRRF